MVAEAEAKLAAQQEKNPKKGGGDKGGRFASVSAHFLGQLNQLTTTLAETNALCPLHQPEHDEEADAFTGGHVLHQARVLPLSPRHTHPTPTAPPLTNSPHVLTSSDARG